MKTKESNLISVLITYKPKKLQEITEFLGGIEISFDGYLRLFIGAIFPEVRSFAFENLLRCEFSSLTKVLDRKLEPDEEILILKRMRDLASNFEEYYFVYSKCKNLDYRNKIIEAMTGLAATFEEWERVYDLPQVTQKKEQVFQKLVELASTPIQLFQILKRIESNDEESKNIILQKMRDCESSIDWVQIYNQSTGECEEIAFQKTKKFLSEMIEGFAKTSHIQV
ncbi:hypothetical protein M0Q03_01270 [bacterium]|jgi:hypothetical protein|nr:hypothetical protein [bacterium]